MCANILGETFYEVVALKRVGLEKKDLFSLAVFEVLGQLLLKGFAVNSSILQNSYKFFSVLAFRFEQFQVSIAQSNAGPEVWSRMAEFFTNWERLDTSNTKPFCWAIAESFSTNSWTASCGAEETSVELTTGWEETEGEVWSSCDSVVRSFRTWDGLKNAGGCDSHGGAVGVDTKSWEGESGSTSDDDSCRREGVTSWPVKEGSSRVSMEAPPIAGTCSNLMSIHDYFIYIYICIYYFNIIFIYLFLTSSQSTFHFPHFCGCTNSPLPFPGRHDYSLLLKLVL